MYSLLVYYDIFCRCDKCSLRSYQTWKCDVRVWSGNKEIHSEGSIHMLGRACISDRRELTHFCIWPMRIVRREMHSVDWFICIERRWPNIWFASTTTWLIWNWEPNNWLICLNWSLLLFHCRCLLYVWCYNMHMKCMEIVWLRFNDVCVYFMTSVREKERNWHFELRVSWRNNRDKRESACSIFAILCSCRYTRLLAPKMRPKSINNAINYQSAKKQQNFRQI